MTTNTERRFPIPWLIGGLAVVGLVVAASLLAGRTPEPLDPGTPEGTVQGYLQAVAERDFVAAHRYLDPTLGEKCSVSDFRAAYLPERWSATIDSVELAGTETVVTVSIEESYGGPFDGGSYVHDEILYLETGADGWRLSQSPWPAFYCEGK